MNEAALADILAKIPSEKKKPVKFERRKIQDSDSESDWKSQRKKIFKNANLNFDVFSVQPFLVQFQIFVDTFGILKFSPKLRLL